MTGFYRVSFWAAIAFSFVMALLPQPPQLPTNPSDKVQHVIAFATLAGLGSVAYRSVPWIRMLGGLSAFGAIIEALQAVPALNRDADLIDWLADTIAAAAVLAAVRWWRSRQVSGTE